MTEQKNIYTLSELYAYQLNKLKMEKLIVDIIGWLGSALLVAAYILVSKKRIDPESIPYQGMNLGGSIMLIVNSYYYGAFPSTAVNVVWIFIGLFYISKKLKA